MAQKGIAHMNIFSTTDTWYVWMIMIICVAAAILLEHHFIWAQKLSALVIVLLFAIGLSNCNIIPTESTVYNAVWDYLTPLALPMLLYKANLYKIKQQSGPLFIAFILGTVGTVLGALVSSILWGKYLNELPGLAAMMTGTYTGGSINMAALAVSFDVSGNTVSAATIADNFNMAIFFFILLSIPVRNSMKVARVETVSSQEIKRPMELKDLALGLGAAFFIVGISKLIASTLNDILINGNIAMSLSSGLLGNTYFWITTISVFCATAFPNIFNNISGMQEIGIYLVYCFMFAIGAPASIKEIIFHSPILLVFAMTIVAIHMIFLFVSGRLFKIDKQLLIIASNANIGGPTTAASMAIAKGWEDLVGPAILVGCLGYVIGNYSGILIGYFCQYFL